MKRLLALLGSVLAAVPAASARPDPAYSPLVEDTIAALQAGDMAELQWLVSAVEPLKFFTAEFRERGEVFSALSGCKPKEIERGRVREHDYYLYEWKCGKEKFRGRLVPEASGNAVVISDIFSKSKFQELDRKFSSFSVPPPPVGPLSDAAQGRLAEVYGNQRADRLEWAEAFARAFAAQDLSAFAEGHGAYRDLTYSFYDPNFEQRYVEKVWDLGKTRAEADVELKQAVGFIHSELGQPTRWRCETETSEPLANCIWFFDEPGAQLEAHMYVRDPASRDWGYLIYWFRYQTQEKMSELESRLANNG